MTLTIPNLIYVTKSDIKLSHHEQNGDFSSHKTIDGLTAFYNDTAFYPIHNNNDEPITKYQDNKTLLITSNEGTHLKILDIDNYLQTDIYLGNFSVKTYFIDKYDNIILFGITSKFYKTQVLDIIIDPLFSYQSFFLLNMSSFTV